MRKLWLWWVVVLAVLTACVGAPSGTPVPPPTATPEPWRPPTVPVTLDNVTSLARLGVNRAFAGTTYHMDFSDDGRYLLTVSGDNAVRVWDVSTGLVMGALEQANSSRAFFAASDTQVVLVTRSGEVKLYRLEDLSLLRTFVGHPGNIGPSAVSPDGRLLALGAEDGSVYVWNLAEEGQAFQFAAHIFPVQVVVFSPDSALLVTVSAERVVRLWDMAAGALHAELTGFDSRPYTAAFSPDGGMVAVGSTNDVRIWSTVSGAQLETIHTAPGAAARQILLTRDGRLLAGGEQDTVSIWDAVTGELFAELPGHRQDFHDMSLNPAEDLLVTVVRPGTAYLWDMSNPNQRIQLGTEDDQFSLAGWTSDGRVLVLAAADGALCFWGIPGESGAPAQ